MTIETTRTSTTECGHCGDHFETDARLLRHLRDDHGYSQKDLEAAAVQLGVDLDMALCEHPNGFGPNGCAGCGDWGPDEPDSSPPVGSGRVSAAEGYEKMAEALRRARESAGAPGDRAGAERPPGPPPEVAPGMRALLGEGPLRSLTDAELAMEFDQDEPTGEDALTAWWLTRAEEEARAVIPKAVAYGSNSLMQLGRKVAQLQGRTVTDAEAMELGCWINAVQKIERWTDSVMRGERCSDDTIYDAGIYVKMVQRIRDVGSWPGV